MLFYEIKVNYERQTGEDNPGKVKETYLVEGVNCADVENRLMEEIKPFIFGDCEVSSCKKVQYFDIFPNEGSEFWYKARVEMITVDGDKETRKAVSPSSNTSAHWIAKLFQSANRRSWTSCVLLNNAAAV